MMRNRVHCSICSQNILMGIIDVLNEIFTCIHKKNQQHDQHLNIDSHTFITSSFKHIQCTVLDKHIT